ncbi:MAG: hypothetical protein WB524_00380 [Acidobacteriaceae bacterium]
MQTVAKRSRFILQPKGQSFRITRNDLAILDLLQTYKYLPSSYIIALLEDPCVQYIKNRLTILRHEAKVIDIPPSAWHAANARYRPVVYQLTDKGRETMKAHGRYRSMPSTSEEFNHQFGVSISEASFAIGAKRYPSLRLHRHEAIFNSKFCPPSTRAEQAPFKIPITFTYHYTVGGHARHKQLDTFVKHDGTPFGFTNTQRPKAQIFFPGIEFDRHTESRASSDYSATTIQKKLQEIRAIAARDGYATRYGIPNAFIPFVTISEARMRSIMDDVEKVTDGKGSQMFLFKSIPDFASFDSFPAADGSMLTTPWKRVGFPNFDILAELGII